METREWTFVDKSKWDRGPWDQEPDKVQWIDIGTGMPCLAVRACESGHWCGYVGITEGHRFYGKDYMDPDYEAGVCSLRVHGGITFGGPCREGEGKEHGICHVPGPGEPDRVWWLGFDCHHCYDVAPGSVAFMRKHGIPPLTFREEVYRDLAYVRAQCALLAQQLKEGV